MRNIQLLQAAASRTAGCDQPCFIGEIEISSTLLDRAKEVPHLDVDPDGHEMAFDASGRIVDVWGAAVGAGH